MISKWTDLGDYTKTFIITVLLLSLGIFAINIIRIKYPSINGNKINSPQLVLNKMSNYPTISMVAEKLIELDIKCPDIVLKQALLESNYLNPHSYAVRMNNLWCFSFNGVKILKFDSWQESVYYYKFWQKYKTGYKNGNYYEHLSKYWKAHDMMSYINTLKKMKYGKDEGTIYRDNERFICKRLCF